ncbi:hypothetical protein B9T16_30270 [Arthrospira sp. PCC 8006]
MFYVDLPDQLALDVLRCKTNAEVRQIGIEWAIKQGKELIAAGVPAIHFYSMGKSDNFLNVAKALF